MHPINPLSGNALCFIILLYLAPDDFTRQRESAATQWVKEEKILSHIETSVEVLMIIVFQDMAIY